MQENKTKFIWFRIITSLLLLAPISLGIIFMILFIKEGTGDIGLLLATEVVLVIFTLIELIILIKNITKPLTIDPLVFNPNKKINTPALVVVLIGLVIGLGLIAGGICLLYLGKEKIQLDTAKILIPISSLLTANCISYLIYIPLFKQKPFKIEDLLK